MKREGGVRSGLFATSVIGISGRSAARNRMSLITAGQASASTQICMHAPFAPEMRGNITQIGGDYRPGGPPRHWSAMSNINELDVRK